MDVTIGAQDYEDGTKQERQFLIPGDQPEVSKCTVPLLINYQSKLVGDDLELMIIAERLLIQKEIAP